LWLLGGSSGRAEALGGGWGRGHGPLPVVYPGVPRVARVWGMPAGGGGERPAGVPEVVRDRGVGTWEVVLVHGGGARWPGRWDAIGAPLEGCLMEGGMGDCRRRPVGGEGRLILLGGRRRPCRWWPDLAGGTASDGR
jgi:hypothetical protein